MAVGCSQTSVIARDTPPFPAFFDVAVTKFTHAAESRLTVPHLVVLMYSDALMCLMHSGALMCLMVLMHSDVLMS